MSVIEASETIVRLTAEVHRLRQQCKKRRSEALALRQVKVCLLAENELLRRIVEDAKPHVQMSRSTTSGHEFHDTVDSLLRRMDLYVKYICENCCKDPCSHYVECPKVER